ncbi:MAG TPA: molybdopterin dinucleotide binding domain-containing protein, partial [Vicinamibacteria bacterium]|nr:molybdopterin dinucleotide binding domain-containing protein [Vicinamibacteria bacterium]
KQVVPPLFDTRAGLDIMKGLAGRLGLESFFQYDIDSVIAAQLAPHGLTAADFDRTGMWSDRQVRSYGTTRNAEYRFRTPSGKVELANERLRRQGLDPLPRYVPPVGPAPGEFRLLPGKQAFFTHAANQNNEWLHELCPENLLWIHRAEAEKRHIGEGDVVIVRSSVGQVRVKAHVTDRLRPDCVHLPHGFGQRSPGLRRARGRGASDQDLIVARSDRITGNAALHETFVSVEKLGAAASRPPDPPRLRRDELGSAARPVDRTT